jgi:hypothetical protein
MAVANTNRAMNSVLLMHSTLACRTRPAA